VSANGILRNAQFNVDLSNESFEQYPIELPSNLYKPEEQASKHDVWWWANPSWYFWWFPGWEQPNQVDPAFLDIDPIDPEQKFDVTSPFRRIFPGGDWTFRVEEDIDTASHYDPSELEDYRQKLLENLSLELTVENPHGTAVASVAAGQKRDGIMSGVAYDANLSALRLIGSNDPLDIELSPNGLTVADALYHSQLKDSQADWRNEQIDIFNNSWRPNYFHVPPSADYALFRGIKNGRPLDGDDIDLGNIYVVAAGNDGHISGDINYNYLAKSRHTIAVGAVREEGIRPDYSTPGAAAMLSAYVGIDALDIQIEGQSDRSSGYNGTKKTIDNFGGTSAAAPQVSGTVALMLEANPNLTARDVQHILIETANREAIEDENADWTGSSEDLIRHSHQYGFGVVDAKAAVEKALEWKALGYSVGTEADLDSFSSGKIIPWQFQQAIPDDTGDAGQTSSTYTVEEDLTLEWVEVDLNIENHSGDLKVWLESPDGTVSELAETHHNPGETTSWTYTSVRHWGRSSKGDWTLYVSDGEKDDGRQSLLKSWNLNLYGSKPEVSLETMDGEASEDGDVGQVTLRRSGNTEHPLTVDYAVAGEGITSGDYRLLDENGTPIAGNQIAIPAGQDSVTVTVEAIDDEVDENGSETLQLSLAAQGSYKLGDQTSATINLADNEPVYKVDNQLGIVNSKVGSLPLNFRSDAYVGASIIGKLSEGTLLKVLQSVTGGSYQTDTGLRNDWYKIEVDGKTGYVAAYYIDLIFSNDPPGFRQVDFSGWVGPQIGVALRNSPKLSDKSSLAEPYEKTLEFDGWMYGESVTDIWTGQPDALWYRYWRDGKAYWVPSAYIYGYPNPVPPLQP
jgi:subtilisin-like proprotein convertase family protein